MTIPGTTAAHRDEVLFVPGSWAKSIRCKMNIVQPLAVLVFELTKPEPFWRSNQEKKGVR